MSIDMSDLLQFACENGISDLHLEVGAPPTMRLHGDMNPLDVPALTAEDTERLVSSIASQDAMRKIREVGTVDFAFAYKDLARFRVSAFKQKGVIGCVLRQIPKTILTLEQLGLPEQVHDLLYLDRGLVLVTGPTGSGKSTTLASMINIINEERACHIITIEDPIEFYHTHRRSIVIQREVGTDVPSFAEALRGALRQDPDVILVGELRDTETMQAAISAAETGHLVFATLHTSSAGQTVDRIIDMFPPEKQAQIRTMLSMALAGVISQSLIPRLNGSGRVAAFEIMYNTSSIAALIRDGKTFQIPSELQTGQKYGMNTLDDHLLQLYSTQTISYDDMIQRAQDRTGLLQRLEHG